MKSIIDLLQYSTIQPIVLAEDCVLCSVAQSCLTLCDPKYCTRQTPLSMGFSRQESWSGLPCPPPGDLPNPGTEPMSPSSSALAVGFLTSKPPGKLSPVPYAPVIKCNQSWKMKTHALISPTSKEKLHSIWRTIHLLATFYDCCCFIPWG